MWRWPPYDKRSNPSRVRYKVLGLENCDWRWIGVGLALGGYARHMKSNPVLYDAFIIRNQIEHSNAGC